MSSVLVNLRSALRDTHRDVFAHVRAVRQASRAQIARATGLSSPAVGAIVADLLDAHLLQTSEETQGERLGRPSQPLQLDRTQRSIIAIQIGVRHTRLAALAVAGPDTPTWPVAFKTPANTAGFKAKLREAMMKLHVKGPSAVAVSVPGVVDEARGESLLCPNLQWLAGQNISDLVSVAFPRGTPVCVVQEIRALALGERWAVPDRRDFLLVDIGEGVGGAAVINGTLYQPPLPMSGELGHVPVLGNHRRCGCGATGCLETLLSRGGMVKSSGQRDWLSLVKALQKNSLPGWLRETLDSAAVAIGGAINLMGLRDVVITGALSELPPYAHEHLAQRVSHAALWARFGSITCTSAPRHRAAGLVVAAVDRILLRIEN